MASFGKNMDQTLQTQSNIQKIDISFSNWYKVVPHAIQILVTSVYWPFMKFFLHYSVSGLENIKDLPNKTAIFAANHTSELDPILVTMILRRVPGFLPIFYVSREKSFYVNSGWRQIIYGGLVFRMCGAYPVYTGQHDYEKSLKNHLSLLEQGNSICIFPEGKRSKDGKVGEARGGVAYMSFRTGKPIVPVAISGIHSLTLKDFLLRRRTLKITIGKPFYPKDLFTDLTNDQLMFDHNPSRIAAKEVMNQVKILY